MGSRRMWIRTESSLMAFILGIIMVFAGYAAWGMITISYRVHIYGIFGIVFTYLTAAFYILLVIMTEKAKRTAESRQLKTVSFIGFIISALLMFRALDGFVLIGVWLIVFGVSLFYGIIPDKRSLGHILWVAVIKKYRFIILVMAFTCLFLYDADVAQARWDGLLYYLTCTKLNIGSMSSLAVYGHIAQTYGMLNGIAGLVVGNTFAAMTALNILLMLSSTWGFYVTLKEVVPEKRESQYALATAIYAWSPFLLGMVYYHSLDFYCGCLFVWVLYALYKRKWIYFSVFSLLFCFTKEPAIIIYAAMCTGVVVADMASDKGFSFLIRLQRCFARKQYYLMVLPGILWFITYRILGPWSAGNGGFSIEADYILEKLSNLYLLNFNWLFTLLAVGGVIWCLTKGRSERMLKLLLPVWCSQIAFTLFSCLFSTANHPRYNDTNQITLYLLAIVPLLSYCGKKKSEIIIGCLSILCLVSSFVTCDPVTRICYDKADIGKRTMIYTADIPLGDGMIYNRQMLGFEVCLERVLEDALRDSPVVLFPTLGNNAYAFDGMAEVGEISDDYMVWTEYWDDVGKRRVAGEAINSKEFLAYQLTDHVDWNELGQDLQGSASYIYIPTIVDPYSEYIQENFRVLEEMEYEHRGWIVKRLSFVSGA